VVGRWSSRRSKTKFSTPTAIPGHPAPKLGVRTIDDYSFLPMVLSGSEPPIRRRWVGGWTRSATSDSRFHDSSRRTQYSEYWTRQWGQHLLEGPPEPRHRPPAVEYSPGPLRTDRSFAVAMVALLGGFAVLGLSAAFDRRGELYAWDRASWTAVVHRRVRGAFWSMLLG
jgi:hypothetical protein